MLNKDDESDLGDGLFFFLQPLNISNSFHDARRLPLRDDGLQDGPRVYDHPSPHNSQGLEESDCLAD